MRYEDLSTHERHAAWKQGCAAVLQDQIVRHMDVAFGPAPSSLAMLFLDGAHVAKIRTVFELGVSKLNASRADYYH